VSGETARRRRQTERISCARISRSLNEPIFGTAPHIQRWILFEEPGPGGCDAVLEERLPAPVARRLKALVRELGARFLLVRRHGRYRPTQRRCYVAYTAPGGSWIRYHTLVEPGDLLDLDWTPLQTGESGGGDPLPHSVYLVCTNGRHDPCCAEFGRKVAHSLQAGFGERVWESSHLGGDRFAANMACLPEGLYFGRVGPGDAPRIVGALERGVVDVAHYRGRCAYPADAQAAECFVRTRYAIDGLDALSLVSRRRLEPDLVEVVLTEVGRAVHTVRVAARRADPGRRLTCREADEQQPTHYELVDATRAATAR
jgi:hypothetical protein